MASSLVSRDRKAGEQCFITRNFPREVGGGARLPRKVPDFLGTHWSQPSGLERLLAQAQPDSLAHWSFYPSHVITLPELQRASVLADGLNEERDTQTLLTVSIQITSTQTVGLRDSISRK